MEQLCIKTEVDIKPELIDEDPEEVERTPDAVSSSKLHDEVKSEVSHCQLS